MNDTNTKNKRLVDHNGKVIEKGTIVHFNDGWMRIQSLCVGKKTVNLCRVFGGGGLVKGVPLAQVHEDDAAWHENWMQSESYRCM